MSENISADKKKRIFHTATGSILSYVWRIWTLHYKLKGKLSSTEIEFWRRTARNSRLVKLRNEGSRETMRFTQTILERMENMFISYGHFVGMEGNRWFNRIMTWSPGRTRRRPPEMKWEKEAEIENLWITGKQMHI